MAFCLHYIKLTRDWLVFKQGLFMKAISLTFLLLIIVFASGCNSDSASSGSSTVSTAGQNEVAPVDVEEEGTPEIVELPRREIMILADSSGSVGLDAWDNLKEFSISLLESEQLKDSETYLNFMSYSGSHLLEIHSDLGDNLISDENIPWMREKIEGLSYLRGTSFLYGALEHTVDILTQPISMDSERILLLVVDAAPYPFLDGIHCNFKQSFDNTGIRFHIIGNGPNFDPDAYSCLVDDPATQITHIGDFTGETLASILNPVASTNTCSDGVMSGNETDVDCGGPNCGLCQLDNGCFANSDCDDGLFCDASTLTCSMFDE